MESELLDGYTHSIKISRMVKNLEFPSYKKNNNQGNSKILI